jgi:tetratricopeptide (TPR) repeat protein
MGTLAPEKEATLPNDVFISYSRKDKEFVHRLDQALTARGREAWVDWEGIRPTEEFMQAIYRAIEGADTFVFVLTPDSVASEVCGREIAHAAAHNKRMIPIVARDVETEDVPGPLAKLNWIFCRETDDFAAAAESLVSAVETDLPWTHAHTRLLTRALEWEAHQKSNSFVLRGEDLKAAEQWLAEAGTEKERQPTTLHTEYIIASRRGAVRRQRITLGAVAFGAIVATVLAIIALMARNRAETERGNAEAATKRATHSRDEAVKLIDFMSFDLRDKLKPIGRLDLLEDVNRRVRAFYDSFEGEEDSDLLRQRGALFNNQGNIARSKGDLTGALENYQASLKIFQRLAKQKPDNALWQRNLSVNFGAIANVQRDQGHLKEALQNQSESVSIIERLTRTAPGNRLLSDDLSDSYSDLGDTQRELGNFGDALKSYEEGFALSKKLTEEEPDNTGWQHDLALRQERVGDMQRAQGDATAAFKSYGQSLAIARKLAERDPQNADWQHDLAGALLKFADLRAEKGDATGALQDYRESVSIAERLVQRDPANAEWLRNLSVGYNGIGDLLDKQRDLASALQSYRDGLAIREKLVRQDASNTSWQRDLSLAYANIGNILRQQKDFSGALESYRKCQLIREELIKRDPVNVHWQRDLSIACRDVGEMEGATENYSAADNSLHRSISYGEQAAAHDPRNTNAQRALLNSYKSLGDVQIRQNDLMDARQSYEQALAGAERLSKQDSGDPLQGDLGSIYARLGMLLYVVEPESETKARSLMEKGREIFLRLKAKVGLTPEQESGLQTIETSLRGDIDKPATKKKSSAN